MTKSKKFVAAGDVCKIRSATEYGRHPYGYAVLEKIDGDKLTFRNGDRKFTSKRADIMRVL